MLVERYINELKKNNEKNKVKQIVKEYNKEIEFKINGPAMTKPSNIYFFSILSLMISLTPLILGNNEIMIIVKAIYSIPLFVFSVMSIVLFSKLRKCKVVNKKKFLTLSNCVILEFLALCFTGTYMIQFFLFDNWGSIDYLKTVFVFIILLIPVIIVGIKNAPKKFIKQFSKENIYKEQSEIVVWISIALVFIANLTKPYMLMLAVFYAAMIYFTPIFILLVYKGKKYDYIQSLLK